MAMAALTCLLTFIAMNTFVQIYDQDLGAFDHAAADQGAQTRARVGV